MIKKLNLKKIKELFTLIFINFLVLSIFMEIGSLAFYFITQKQLFYTRNQTQGKEVFQQVGIKDEASLDETIQSRLHPFFGFISKPGLPFSLEFSKVTHKVNNYGFVSDYNYPFIKTNKEQFIIGVFGGSVANNFAIYEKENKIIEKNLKRLPELANKEIVILPFATGGYKQPQQLLILNYFLSIGQEFDLVLNIDGFNEVALSNLNNQQEIEVSMPSIQHILPLTKLGNNNLSEEELTLTLNIQQDKSKLRKAIAALDRCQLASCYALRLFSLKFQANSYQKNILAFDKLTTKNSQDKQQDNAIFQINRVVSAREKSVAFEKMASLWSDSSQLMKEALSKKDILYFHIIQPNQYYPTKKVFSPKEKKIAILENHPYAEGVTQGYPVLLSKVGHLKKSNINVFNALNLFDNIKEMVYVDTCCHYNKVGSEIFSNYISRSVVEVLTNNANGPKVAN